MIGYTAAFTVLVTGFNLVSRTILSKAAVGGLTGRMDKALGAVFGGIEAVLTASAAIVILHTYSAEVATIPGLPGGSLPQLP